ncbi:MAG: sigma-70 family RNA polymerase sigma factor [Myxococcota bacterium]
MAKGRAAKPTSKTSSTSAKAKSTASKAETGRSAPKKKPAAPADGPKVLTEIDTSDKRAICEQFTPYVRSIAGKVKKTVAKEIDFDDLVEYGMIGLLEASDRYDPKYGANFMTFAYYRIRGAIYDGLRGMGWMSRSEYAKARFEERANEYLAEVAMAEESGTEIPENPFEHAVQDLASAVQGLAAVYLTSLDGSEALQLEDEKSPNPDEVLGLEQARHLVRDTIKKLNDQERQLLELYYYKEKSLQEVGEVLGLSKSWTSRLHARVIERLHRLLQESL